MLGVFYSVWRSIYACEYQSLMENFIFCCTTTSREVLKVFHYFFISYFSWRCEYIVILFFKKNFEILTFCIRCLYSWLFLRSPTTKKKYLQLLLVTLCFFFFLFAEWNNEGNVKRVSSLRWVSCWSVWWHLYIYFFFFSKEQFNRIWISYCKLIWIVFCKNSFTCKRNMKKIALVF